MGIFVPGDIHYADLPEPLKSRPVVVLSEESINTARGKVVAAIITTRVRGNSFEIPVGGQEGLSKESVISTTDIYTIDNRVLSSRKGSLSAEKMELLRERLKLLFAIP